MATSKKPSGTNTPNTPCLEGAAPRVEGLSNVPAPSKVDSLLAVGRELSKASAVAMAVKSVLSVSLDENRGRTGPCFRERDLERMKLISDDHDYLNPRYESSESSNPTHARHRPTCTFHQLHQPAPRGSTNAPHLPRENWKPRP